ncbi:hypothetical protein BDN70DRAFT_929842 [Pholiota conissans]|uniref:Heterokaryon incompatibility domain-containing protein n=1 Tax=Pholiota conissans TaxID=109636 RepID=A0A9P5Z6L6_9AGAR|nr:hypothetical protein BDN70DRAFT_929842 [Pholiota conissans]
MPSYQPREDAKRGAQLVPLGKKATSVRVLLHDERANLEELGEHVRKLRLVEDSSSSNGIKAPSKPLKGETYGICVMEQDKWFRRGWTLQELIAPPRIHFYLEGWQRLKENTENDNAEPEIQQIVLYATAIEAKELISFDPLTSIDIATRMTWAANRETTRGEDQAYSLMGIFGVHFPISYGEGAERAFF